LAQTVLQRILREKQQILLVLLYTKYTLFASTAQSKEWHTSSQRGRFAADQDQE